MPDLFQQSAEYFIQNFQVPEMKEKWTEEKLLSVLTPIIQKMLNSDFERLLHLCYRIDLGENLLKKILHESDPEFLAQDLARALIQRQLKKTEIRNLYKD
jgi:hypothetical protein